MNDVDLLTMSEAAALLRVPRDTLKYWRVMDQGPRGFKVGRRVLYRRADVVSWIDRQAAADPRFTASAR